MNLFIIVLLCGGCGGGCSVGSVYREKTIRVHEFTGSCNATRPSSCGDCGRCGHKTCETGFCRSCDRYTRGVPVAKDCTWTYQGYKERHSFRTVEGKITYGGVSTSCDIPVVNDCLPRMKCRRDKKGVITGFICDYSDKIPYDPADGEVEYKQEPSTKKSKPEPANVPELPAPKEEAQSPPLPTPEPIPTTEPVKKPRVILPAPKEMPKLPAPKENKTI
jgi:hypothetical protein